MKYLQKIFGINNSSKEKTREAAKRAVEESDDILRYLEEYDKGEQQFDPSHLGPLGKYL